MAQRAGLHALDFAQGFRGTFSTDGNTIDGRWASPNAGDHFELDFAMTYTRR